MSFAHSTGAIGPYYVSKCIHYSLKILQKVWADFCINIITGHKSLAFISRPFPRALQALIRHKHAYERLGVSNYRRLLYFFISFFKHTYKTTLKPELTGLLLGKTTGNL